MRDNIAEDCLNNVKTEKNKIQFFSIALYKDAWVENLLSAAYLLQQCVIDLLM